MNVTALRLELRVDDCHTPREKRRRMRAIMDKLHQHFNVAVAEVDQLGSAETAVLGVVTVAQGRREARDVLDRVVDAMSAHPRLQVIGQTLYEV